MYISYLHRRLWRPDARGLSARVPQTAIVRPGNPPESD
jgi:hypothetical protein